MIFIIQALCDPLYLRAIHCPSHAPEAAGDDQVMLFIINALCDLPYLRALHCQYHAPEAAGDDIVILLILELYNYTLSLSCSCWR